MGDLILFETYAEARLQMMDELPASACANGVATRASVGVREQGGARNGGGSKVLRAPRPKPAVPRSDRRPMFFFDLACPFSYIAADRVERLFGDVEWVPVPGHELREEELGPDELMAQAAEVARAARLPLVSPEHFPAAVPSAMRAAAYAAETGAGARFALAASRLAFGGGFDLERRSVLEEVAAAARVPRDEIRAAASEDWRDNELRAMASLLRTEGMTHTPVVSIGGRWFQGAQALSQAVSWRRSA
jgi:2-hydroxychromene-2-carboxylate isomerase